MKHIPICNLEISIRAFNALRAFGIETVADILEIPADWPLSGVRIVPGIGKLEARLIANAVANAVAESLNPPKA